MAMKQALKKDLLTDVLSRCETAEEAAKKATEEATNRMFARDGKLFTLLLSEKKYDEAERAATDSGYRTKVFEMYGI